MIERQRRWLHRTGRIALSALLLAALGGGGLTWLRGLRSSSHADLTGIPTAAVKRTDLFASIRTGGKLASSKQTKINCEIEALYFSSGGRWTVTSGASTILSLVPEGSTVQKGDVLCTFDASDYAELVREQEIKVMEARADLDAARLQLEVGEVGLREYRDGLSIQTREQNRSKIALARSNDQLSADRLVWANRMAQLGYIPSSQVTSSKQDKQRAEIDLKLATNGAKIFEEFSIPKATRKLEAQLEGYRSLLTYQTMRVNMNEERLAHYRLQVERCTIRAPHDGFLIYANNEWGSGASIWASGCGRTSPCFTCRT